MSLDSDGDADSRIAEIKESLSELGPDTDLEAIFDAEFMEANTGYGSLSSFYDESPRTLEDETDLTQIDDAGFDAYVSDNSVFKDWDSMVNKAAEDHVGGQFGN